METEAFCKWSDIAIVNGRNSKIEKLDEVLIEAIHE